MLRTASAVAAGQAYCGPRSETHDDARSGGAERDEPLHRLLRQRVVANARHPEREGRGFAVHPCVPLLSALHGHARGHLEEIRRSENRTDRRGAAGADRPPRPRHRRRGAQVRADHERRRIARVGLRHGVERRLRSLRVDDERRERNLSRIQTSKIKRR